MSLRNTPDSTDAISNKIKLIFQPILDEFKDFIAENDDKKSFISGLIKIFAILWTVQIAVAVAAIALAR